VSPPRLSRALAGSAAVHLGVAAALLALARPGVPTAPPLRVSLVATSGAPEASSPGAGAPGTPPAAAEPAPSGASAASSRPVRRPSPTARRSEPEGGADQSAATASAQALVTPVQSDLWILAAPGSRDRAPASGQPAAAPAAGGPSASAPAAAPVPTAGQGAGGEPPGGENGTGGSSAASLLAALSQRLAWSAERCAPAGTVRLTRRTVPGVPLHFCLDAAGRPSDVDLLGTTGSDALDRAARDCVVPGALPLPPAPGCYTVEVRFPIRG